MASSAKFAGLVQKLESFVEAKDPTHRGTAFVAEIESEFVRAGLDAEEELTDLQHALAMYRGHEEDIRELKNEAEFAIRRLTVR